MFFMAIENNEVFVWMQAMIMFNNIFLMHMDRQIAQFASECFR